MSRRDKCPRCGKADANYFHRSSCEARARVGGACEKCSKPSLLGGICTDCFGAGILQIQESMAKMTASMGQMQIQFKPDRSHPCVSCGKIGASLGGSCGTCISSAISAASTWTFSVPVSFSGTFSGVTMPSCLEAAAVQKSAPLETVHQDELFKGTKYATLWCNDGKPEFGGTGHTGQRYGTEAIADCAAGGRHPAPEERCTCGFWIPARQESALSSWRAAHVALEVEFGGKVLDCGHDPLPAPPWGYRAQYQRVLSVSLSPWCALVSPGVPCGDGGARYLVRSRQGHVLSACGKHAANGNYTIIGKPVTWLREGLQTEIRPGLVADDEAPEPCQPAWSSEGPRMISWTRNQPGAGSQVQWEYRLMIPPGQQAPDEVPYPANATDIRWRADTDSWGGTLLTWTWME